MNTPTSARSWTTGNLAWIAAGHVNQVFGYPVAVWNPLQWSAANLTAAWRDDGMRRKVFLQRLVKGHGQHLCVVRAWMTTNHIDGFAIAFASGNGVALLVVDIPAADLHGNEPLARFR